MMQLSVEKDLLGPWLAAKVGMVWAPEGRELVGLLQDGKPVAAALFENCTGLSMECHVAVDRPGLPLRQWIIASFRYAFVQNGVEKLIGRVNSNNRAALHFDYRLGFDPWAVIPRVYKDGGDCLIMVLLRERCKWIPAEYRREAA